MNRNHPFFNRTIEPLNIDIAHRCALECSKCGRQTSFLYQGKSVPGYNLTLEEFDKITDHFKNIAFCGQYSDPIHHPQFIDFIKLAKKKEIRIQVHVASSARPKSWFVEAFQAYPEATWIFGIDGLPEESHLYRVNQDGPKLFDIMLEARRYLIKKVHWQYILFKYNEEHVEEAMQLAKEKKLFFNLIQSSRWNDNDPLKPTMRS